MDILWNLLMLALGFVLLVKGADWFVDGAAGIANKFKIPQLIIGLTIVAMGTPSGVGMAFQPTRYMHPGDVVRCEIEGIGILENPVE